MSVEIIVFIIAVAFIIGGHWLIRKGIYRTPVKTTGEPLYETAGWLRLSLLGLYGFTLTVLLGILDMLPEPNKDILGPVGLVMGLVFFLLERSSRERSSKERKRITNIMSFILGVVIALICAPMFNNS